MRLTVTSLALLSIVLFSSVLLSGEKGDEEGEYYNGKWPSDIPKKTPVKYYLPFPAGKSFGRMPGAASHTALQNKHAIDFSMRTGSPVCAAADGIVIKIIESGPDRGGRQNSLIIQHADGMCTCYLHLKNKGVTPTLGDFVFRGDVVAYSGASGTGVPHLHFSVNKFEMLESVQFKFVENASSKQWVSQNYSFEQKYAKKLKDFRETELKLVLGPKLGFWGEAFKAREQVKKIKPKESDDVRLNKKYKKIEEAAKAFDETLKSYLKSLKDAFENKKYEKALEMAHFGVKDFKGTEHEKFFAEMLAKLEKLENYEELSKTLKKAQGRRKRLEKVFKSDIKGAKAIKTAKDYLSFVKKYKDSPEAAAVKERGEAIKASLKEKKK